MMNLLFTNIKSLVGVRPLETKILKGKELKELPSIENAWLHVKDGKIAAYGQLGSSEHFKIEGAEKIDCTGKFILPCWCDSHTHLVFADWRQEEFVYKIHGMSYEEIASRGGGILNSAKKMETAGEEYLLESAAARIRADRCWGARTGTSRIFLHRVFHSYRKPS